MSTRLRFRMNDKSLAGCYCCLLLNKLRGKDIQLHNVFIPRLVYVSEKTFLTSRKQQADHSSSTMKWYGNEWLERSKTKRFANMRHECRIWHTISGHYFGRPALWRLNAVLIQLDNQRNCQLRWKTCACGAHHILTCWGVWATICISS